MARDYEAGRNKVQFGVGIPLPLFDRNQGNVYAATMRSYKARDQYRDLEARLAAELLQSVSQYDLATGTANDYRATVLPSARRATTSRSRASRPARSAICRCWTPNAPARRPNWATWPP